MNRDDILHEAMHCINVDRAATHGDAEDSFSEIAKLWDWFLQNRPVPEAELLPEDVSMMLALFKIGRIVGNPSHEDSFVDAIGYLAIAGEISTQK
jgi:hypothetical protein